MSPKNFMTIAIVLFASSVALEINVLAGVMSLGETSYHSIHIALMATLAASQFALYFYGKQRGVQHKAALLFGIGLCLTGTGDFVNGAISGIEPVSLKLTWAMLLFGLGYIGYCVALWTYNSPILRSDTGTFARFRYLVAIPFLVLNVGAWLMHVEPNFADTGVLYYGSFVFNATIYVVMPMLGVWYYHNTGRSVGGLIVLLGTLFLPFSDLVLFSSWLRDGDPAVATAALYAYNWIVYFGGQILVGMFPAQIIDAELSDEVISVGA
ncbi:MAG: hypothetical protein JHC87_07900 [Thermoleophilaceae bacterium]|nr:hypothetical protein [Thermoleophilaceae bacterium]